MAIIERFSLKDRVYQEIKRMIINGEIPPGARIKEEELAKKFGISRTPVREALGKLESLGFIRKNKPSGYVAREFTKDDIEEIYGIMGILEEYAVILAAENITSNDIKKLKKLLDDLEKALLRDDMEEVVKLNNRFHDILYGLSGRKRLVNLINYFRDLFNIFRRWLLIEKESAAIALKDHRKIVDLLERGEKKSVIRRTVRSHIERGKKLTLKKLEEVGRGEEKKDTRGEARAGWA